MYTQYVHIVQYAGDNELAYIFCCFNLSVCYDTVLITFLLVEIRIISEFIDKNNVDTYEALIKIETLSFFLNNAQFKRWKNKLCCKLLYQIDTV